MIKHHSFLTLEYVSLSSRPASLCYQYLPSLSRGRLQSSVTSAEASLNSTEDQPWELSVVRRHQQLTTGFHSTTLLYNTSSFIFQQHEDSFLIQLTAINDTLIIISACTLPPRV